MRLFLSLPVLVVVLSMVLEGIGFQRHFGK
ncbi:APOC1 isoform 5 [Pongo abelii]|uniref:APOC1 isoform 5 n=5 Tax=Catarrhini TaxID=9526 RepID=A0A2J8RTS3_PONAB|nr:APOC1 isoform 5 [Pongo abelii]